MCFHFLSDPGNPRPTKLNFLLEVGIENLVNIILAIQQVLTLYIYVMTNNNAHQLPALIKVSSFMQPQRFSLQSARARSLGSAVGEGERSEVFAPVTTEGQRKHHVVCLSGAKTEGTKTFCPYGGAAVAAVGRAKQSAPGFRGLTIVQTFPMENRHSVRNSKNNKGHKFSGLNN